MAEESENRQYDPLFEEALSLRESLYRMVRTRAGNAQDAEDITQESLLRFYRRVVKGKFRPPHVRDYLFKIGINQSNDFLKERRKSPREIYEASEDLAYHDTENVYAEQVEFLRKNLDAKDFTFLAELIRLSRLEEMALPEIANLDSKGLESLKERLSELHGRYTLEGRIVLPPRKIMGIGFDPVSIRFKSGFEGDPLTFFQQHTDVYGGLSRTQLSKFDQTLYTALRRKNQIDEAIPFDRRYGKRPELSVKEQRRIVSTFKSHRSSARAAATDLPYSPQTVLKYVKKGGATVRRRSAILESEKEEIVAAYETHRGVVSHAAKALGRSRKLITDVWRGADLEVSSDRGIESLRKMKGQNCLSKKKSQRIIASFEKCSGVISRAAKHTGHCPATIKRHWEKAGLI